MTEDETTVTFLRSKGGDDTVNCLWSIDVSSGEERLIADPIDLVAEESADLPDAERRRRERTREVGAGIVSYATDRSGTKAAFALGGHLFVADVATGEFRAISTRRTAFDPRPDPDGKRIGYVSGDHLRYVAPDGEDHEVIGDEDVGVSWGSAEFIAAEEMGRTRGYWWSPDGSQLIVARVDVRSVARWHIASPAAPDRVPDAVRYPAAGGVNADVQLGIVGIEGPVVRMVEWDSGRLPYLVDVRWRDGEPLTITVQSRDQRTIEVLEVDSTNGATSTIAGLNDPDWVEIVPGVPAWYKAELVTVGERDGTRRLLVDGEPVTPTSLWVRGVAAATSSAVWFTASDDSTEVHVYRFGASGIEPITSEPGVHDVVVRRDVAVVTSSTLTGERTAATIFNSGGSGQAITNLAERPLLSPQVHLSRAGAREIATAVLYPTSAPDEPLPVLLDPYGGPHVQRVLKARNAYLVSQWFADQGFVVVIADGRGTPGRGGEWERAVRGDLAGPVLDDQVDVLRAVAEQDERLDLGRVAIRGWSFGGYLAALGVLRRPDVFHAAIAGAPITDWSLYDTHYTERYLGLPSEEPENYERTSLIADAHRLKRPLLLIHGLADDNVVVAHTLQLSRALLEAGRPHQVLPLSGVTHMTPQEVVAENLLRLQAQFLLDALASS